MATTPWTDSIHTYEPDANGRCTSGWANDAGQWVPCRSTQRSSTLHDDPDADFRERHDHGGGDCMCFENEDGPSYYEAMEANREGREPRPRRQRRRGDDIPPVSAYAHYNEEAQSVWYAENRYDMEHADEIIEDDD